MTPYQLHELLEDQFRYYVCPNYEVPTADVDALLLLSQRLASAVVQPDGSWLLLPLHSVA